MDTSALWNLFGNSTNWNQNWNQSNDWDTNQSLDKTNNTTNISQNLNNLNIDLNAKTVGIWGLQNTNYPNDNKNQNTENNSQDLKSNKPILNFNLWWNNSLWSTNTQVPKIEIETTNNKNIENKELSDQKLSINQLSFSIWEKNENKIQELEKNLEIEINNTEIETNTKIWNETTEKKSEITNNNFGIDILSNNTNTGQTQTINTKSDSLEENTKKDNIKTKEESQTNKKQITIPEIILPELTPQINQNIAPIQTIETNKQQEDLKQKEVTTSVPTYNQIPTEWININKITTNKPTQIKRSWPDNIWWLIIGCSIFFIVILGVIAWLLYYFTLNPDQVNAFIDSETVKALLKIFTTIFFWFLFFVWFGIATMNGYRIATVKNLPKKNFYIWLIFWVFLLFFSLATGITILRHINEMTSEDINMSDLVFIQVPMKDGAQFLHKNPNLLLVAPVQLNFAVNPELRSRFVADNLWNNKPKNVYLDCGNGQKVPIAPNLQSIWSCFFETKWEYEMNLIVEYTDRITNSPKQAEAPSDLDIISQIDIKTSDGTYQLNDDKTEMIMWKAPIKVYFDASKIFSDLKLWEYKISRDLDANWEFDLSDQVSFAHIFREPKIQTIYYTIPELGKEIYSLIFRVEQSDVPVCEVQTEQVKWLTFDFKANCDRNWNISRYAFHIFDTRLNREVETIDSDKDEVRYNFPSQWKYIVKMTFITDTDKQWRAESETIDVGNISFDVNYDITYRWANDKERTRFGKDGNNKMIKNNSWTSLTIWSVPMKLQLNINNIKPIIKWTEVMVYLDEKPMLPNNNKDMIYEINIEEPKKQEIIILIKNETINSDQIKIVIPIDVDQPDIVWVLEIYPETVWESPFDVTLDASAVKLTDPKDKVVYFTWKFWDGAKDINTSQWTAKHTYTYDDLVENWTYNPEVIVTTSKWLSKKITAKDPIMVRKPRLMALINIDSHPWQIAKVEDEVIFSIRSDGNIESISWDFGDWETLTTEWRLSIEAKHKYIQPGQYKIKAEVVYDNKTISTPNITLVVDN